MPIVRISRVVRSIAVGGLILVLVPSCSGDSSSSFGYEAGGDCVEAYSPNAVANRAFAFDGTVTGVEVRQDPRLPAGDRERIWVTFDVNHWYRGWMTDRVSVWFDLADPGAVPIGERVLVSGEARWGGDPDQDPIAWPCGFTRSWDEATASRWASALPTSTA